MQKSENDIVQDILARVLEAQAKQAGKPLDEAALKKIEASVRQQWAGDRPYIGITGADGHSDRNSRIYRQHLQGERAEFLARRHGISKSQVLRVIQAAKSNGVK